MITAHTFIGNEIYVGFPKNYVNIPEFLKLFVLTNEDDAVGFSVDTLKGFHFSNTVRKNQTVEVELPISFEVQIHEQRYNGIKVTSQNNKSTVVYAQSYRTRSSGMFAALPCSPQNVTEYEYYGVTFDGVTNGSTRTAHLLFVGCENDTVIKVGQFTISLNEMETYIHNDARGLTGTRVVSNKPISFITGHQCINVPSTKKYCDFLIDQLPNTALWGKEFLSAPLFRRTAPDIYLLVSYLPSTVTTMVCSNSLETRVITLSKFPKNHEVVTIPGSAYCSIESNNPVLVVQFASSGEADNTRSDPFMMNIPPIDQYSNSYVVVVPAEFPSSVITVFVTPEYFQPDEILIDGIPQSNANWTDILCYNETVCAYSANTVVDEGQHRVHHERQSAKMSVSVYGFKEANGYGYYAVGDLKLHYSPSQNPNLITTVSGILNVFMKETTVLILILVNPIVLGPLYQRHTQSYIILCSFALDFN